MARNEIERYSRRAFVVAAVAVAAVPIVACSQGEQGARRQREPADFPPLAMTVYRDPSCPCCENWVAIAQQAGFAVTMIEDANMPARKKALGVPEALASCHTVEVAGLVFEGHVPIAHIRQLLASNEGGLAGLAVPGMPRGSPGMEMPDGSKDPFDVIGFDRRGNTSVFARV